MHSNLKPSWNAQQTLDEQETEKGDDVKNEKSPRDEDSQSIISYDGAAIDNFDTASIRSRHLDNGYAKRLTPTSEIVLNCDSTKINLKGFSEKDTTELKVFSIDRAHRLVNSYIFSKIVFYVLHCMDSFSYAL